MICRICSGYIEDGKNSCPHCGSAVNTKSSTKKKEKYYCKRCYRFLPSKICPIHGTEATIGVDAETAEEGSVRPIGAEVPKPAPSAQPIPMPAGTNGNISEPLPNSDDDQFLNKILEDVISDREPTLRDDETEAPPIETQRSPNESGSVPSNQESLSGMIEEQFQRLVTEREEPQRRTAPRQGVHIKSAPPTPGAHPRKAAPRKKAPPTSSSKWIRWMAFAAVVLLLAVAGAAFKFYMQPIMARKAMLTQAEELYKNQQYDEALQKYAQFKVLYPNAAAIGTVNDRIIEISTIIEKKQQKNAMLASLMTEAQRTFSQNHFLTPENDNTYGYLRQVFEIEPDYPPAVELQDQIVNNFLTQAEKAFDAENYDEALKHYQNALTIKPRDNQLLDEIDRTLKLKNIKEMLHNLSALTKTRKELKALQRERKRLQNLIQKERSRFRELTEQRKKNSTPLASASTTERSKSVRKNNSVKQTRAATTKRKSKVLTKTERQPRSTRPKNASPPPSPVTQAGSNAGTVEDLLGIELIPSEPEASSAPTSESRIVEEQMIDGGEKKYIHREKPNVPASLKGDELQMILAECVVSVDGNIESVKLLTPAENEKLNQIALNALHKYRFKPATFHGKPVRFKTIEVMTF